jgi:hypothetical protein
MTIRCTRNRSFLQQVRQNLPGLRREVLPGGGNRWCLLDNGGYELRQINCPRPQYRSEKKRLPEL